MWSVYGNVPYEPKKSALFLFMGFCLCLLDQVCKWYILTNWHLLNLIEELCLKL